jgi:hypothetical protein
MAVESHQLSSLLANQLQRLNINRLLRPLVKRLPFLAKIMAAIAALPGLILLYGFPVTAVILLMQLPQRFGAATTIMDWAFFAASLLIMLVCSWMTWLIIRTPLRPPHGLAVDHTSTPALLALIDELENSYGRASVHSVVLRSDFDIQLLRTPRFGLPILTTNTLAIGLPLLLSLPPSHFKALLARRIGQASGKHNRLSGWFYQLNGIWRCYRDNYAHQKSPAIQLLGVLFKFYVPFYEKLALYTLRQDEEEADRYALELINDRDMAGVMSQEIITRRFLQQKYWPKIKQLVRRGGESNYAPFRQMSRVVQKSLNADEARGALMAAINEPDDLNETMPPLKSRLDNIGHQKTGAPTPLNEIAATEYIETATLNKIVDKFDQRWLKHQQQRASVRN